MIRVLTIISVIYLGCSLIGVIIFEIINTSANRYIAQLKNSAALGEEDIVNCILHNKVLLGTIGVTDVKALGNKEKNLIISETINGHKNANKKYGKSSGKLIFLIANVILFAIGALLILLEIFKTGSDVGTLLLGILLISISILGLIFFLILRNIANIADPISLDTD